jgi:uncharacterized repeat protein (TIGR01451 family)
LTYSIICGIITPRVRGFIYMIKKIFIIIAFLLLTYFASSPVGAYEYGQEEHHLQIMVNKEVKSPLESDWHDNLSSDQETFAPDDFIEFRITVKNIGDQELTNVRLTDFLPDFLNPNFNPGDFDSTNKQIKWTIDHLDPGEQQDFLIKVEVVSSDQLPSQSLFCLVNRINVDTDQGQSDSDTAHFCINPKVLAASLPQAGNNIFVGTLIGAGLLAFGIFARKFGRGEILA